MISSKPSGRSDGLSEPPQRRRITWRVALIGALIFAAIVGLLAICFPATFRHQLTISVARQPTPYTQLFFSSSTALPKKLVVNRASHVSFTVVNDEGHPTAYHYTVTISLRQGQKIASAGSFTLRDNQSITRTAIIKPTARKARYLIRISLDGTDNFIQFYASTA